jgi:hypothetical protein
LPADRAAFVAVSSGGDAELRSAVEERLAGSARAALFATGMGRGVQTSNRQQYMASPDGQRFLMNSIVEEAMRSPITVVLDWRNER